jgi:hypothetical protein
MRAVEEAVVKVGADKEATNKRATGEATVKEAADKDAANKRVTEEAMVNEMSVGAAGELSVPG